MKVGDKVHYGNGKWTVVSVSGQHSQSVLTIEQARRDWSGEDSIAVAEVLVDEVTVIV